MLPCPRRYLRNQTRKAFDENHVEEQGLLLSTLGVATRTGKEGLYSVPVMKSLSSQTTPLLIHKFYIQLTKFYIPWDPESGTLF